MATSTSSDEKTLPTLKWGILGTGWMSTKFVQDLLVARPTALATHQIVAIGSSSLDKATKFTQTVFADAPSSDAVAKPRLYADYQGVYDDADVDIVYVGTPHALHKENCLDAIARGKHLLCEKPFTINEKDAREVVERAREKGVYVLEGVWTRFLPVVKSLQEHLHTKKSIGDIQRVFVDFGLDMGVAALPANSRLKDPALGGGALLDIGLYSLTIASLVLGNGKVGDEHPAPWVISSLNITEGIDYSNTVILRYPHAKGRDATAVCTSTMLYKSCEDFCRIEGSEGTIILFGGAASIPSGFRLRRKGGKDGEEEVFKFEHPGVGWHFEADAVAIDLSQGRTESAIMPLAETLRVLRLTDTIRKQGGLVYPQDKE